ncbi:MAG: hypothetical protein LW808_001905 [Verrucomicrobiota bacterium]|nr:MAG: hypothetical protein LW808_001905 [Verrucomicrobiota bacterium]
MLGARLAFTTPEHENALAKKQDILKQKLSALDEKQRRLADKATVSSGKAIVFFPLDSKAKKPEQQLAAINKRIEELDKEAAELDQQKADLDQQIKDLSFE